MAALNAEMEAAAANANGLSAEEKTAMTALNAEMDAAAAVPVESPERTAKRNEGVRRVSLAMNALTASPMKSASPAEQQQMLFLRWYTSAFMEFISGNSHLPLAASTARCPPVITQRCC